MKNIYESQAFNALLTEHDIETLSLPQIANCCKASAIIGTTWYFNDGSRLGVIGGDWYVNDQLIDSDDMYSRTEVSLIETILPGSSSIRVFKTGDDNER